MACTRHKVLIQMGHSTQFPIAHLTFHMDLTTLRFRNQCNETALTRTLPFQQCTKDFLFLRQFNLNLKSIKRHKMCETLNLRHAFSTTQKLSNLVIKYFLDNL